MSNLSPVAQGTALETCRIAGIQFETCPVSGGVWLSCEELEKFDDAPLLSAATEGVRYDPRFESDNGSLRVSPCHPDTVMERHVFGHRHPVEVDTCPISGGMWFDRSEIECIRHYYPDHADLHELASTLSHEFAGSPDGSDHGSMTVRFANLLRWISVTPVARAS